MCTVLQKDTPKIEYPHIEKVPGVCGRSPKIVGTRFTVRSVVTYILKLGMTPEELVDEFTHLTLAQVHSALSYYYQHADEIHKEMEENTEEYWKNKLKGKPWANV